MNTELLFQPYKDKLKAGILLGPPGDLTDSIFQILSDLDCFYALSLKKILNKTEKKPGLGEFCDKYTSKGMPLPDDMIQALCKGYFEGILHTYEFCPESQVLLLEGVPFNKSQAESFQHLLEVLFVVVLDVSALNSNSYKTKEKALRAYQTEALDMLKAYPESKVFRVNGNQKPHQIVKDILISINHII
jgi:adenylate kinase family enzyme